MIEALRSTVRTLLLALLVQKCIHADTCGAAEVGSSGNVRVA
jgi:hypothetical protein